MVVLRDYQDAALTAILREFLGRQAVMIELPTGCGKTEVFVALAEGWQLGRVLVVVPTIELIGQAAKKIFKRTGIEPGIEQGKRRSNESSWGRSQFVVGCRPSLCSKDRYKRFSGIGLVIVDECHLAETAANKEMLDYFREQGAYVLGVSATPKRKAAKIQSSIFEVCAFQMSLADAIHNGWLAPPVAHCVQIESLDLSTVRTVAGDFNQEELAKVMEEERVVFEIAEVVSRESGRMKTIVFCASIKEAMAVSDLLVDKYGLKSAWICGDKTLVDDDRRHDILQSFQHDPNGIQIVCNVGVLTTGYDFPGLEHIVVARPTKSLTLYTQILGRGTRTLPGTVDFHPSTAETRKAAIAASGKPHFKITDMADNSLEHKLISVADVMGGQLGSAVIERAKVAMQRTREPVSVDQALLDAKRELELEQEEIARRKRAAVEAKANYRRVEVDVFDESQRGEIHDRTEKVRLMKFGKYKDRPMSEVPLDYLRWAVKQEYLKFAHGGMFQELKRRKKEREAKPVQAEQAEVYQGDDPGWF